MDFETITRHCLLCDADVEVPVDMLATMAQMPKLVARSFQEPRTPDRQGWSPHEVAAHLADIEVTLGWRIRQVLAVDEPELQPFDQERWAVVLGYSSRGLATSLATYAANRQANLEILRALDQSGWDRKYRHPEFGHRPLRTLIEHIADHDVAHLKQIRGES